MVEINNPKKINRKRKIRIIKNQKMEKTILKIYHHQKIIKRMNLKKNNSK